MSLPGYMLRGLDGRGTGSGELGGGIHMYTVALLVQDSFLFPRSLNKHL